MKSTDSIQITKGKKKVFIHSNTQKYNDPNSHWLKSKFKLKLKTQIVDLKLYGSLVESLLVILRLTNSSSSDNLTIVKGILSFNGKFLKVIVIFVWKCLNIELNFVDNCITGVFNYLVEEWKIMSHFESFIFSIKETKNPIQILFKSH